MQARDRWREIQALPLLPRRSPSRPALVALCGVAGVALGVVLLWLQVHLDGARADGQTLGVVSGMLADGSGPLTLWPGWAAAACFGGAAAHLLREPAEPPIGHADDVTSMRRALRRECDTVRGALTVVSLVALLDCCRALVYVVAAAVGSAAARDSVVPTTVEALGLAAATVALATWVWGFERQLSALGA